MLPAASRTELERILAEDAPHGDLTTACLGIAGAAGEMVFRARNAMVLAEAESAAELLRLAGCSVVLQANSGDQLDAGASILAASGPAGALHRGWKVAQTLIETWSGVASAARAIVDAAREVAPTIAVACTRKTAAGTKSFAVRAVRVGGAGMHRLGLSETVLVFPEHRVFLDGESLAATVERLRAAVPEKKLVIEVKSVTDALDAADAGFDVIQLEKMAPQNVGEVMRYLGFSSRRPIIAAAGGINAGNAVDYATAGADVLVTSAPYLAPPRDVAVTISRAPTAAG